MSDRGQKTEQATARRLERARREGQFPTAKQFLAAAQFMAFIAIAGRWGGAWLSQARQTTRFLFRRAFAPELHTVDLVRISTELLVRMFLPLAAVGGALLVVIFAAQMAVTRFGLSASKLTPDFKRLSPLARLKELPRQNFPALIQAMVLIPVFGAAVYFICRDRFAEYFVLPLEGVETGALQVGNSLAALLWRGAGVKNYLALRIRRIAMDHEVPLIENPPLAQALYKSADVGQEIPAHLYRAVAEILAYIYRLMNGRLPVRTA
ncbi:MAG: EscU/YscU/HrcU family type III secretion system export apparatus switch protein [Candidatus Solibacter usitatus]|nr:EscU/YscU/HrcU family type III secretion system export apparatus switch protein [Candidatus Solibacter usitatus]